MNALRLGLIVAASIAAVALIRRRASRGVGAWLSAPGHVVSAATGTTVRVLRRAAAGVSAQARQHYADAVGASAHPFASAVLVGVLAVAWAVGTGLYLNRNAAIVLASHREAVRTGAALPVAGEQVIAFAQVLAPVLLTAAVGIVVFEIVGVSDHLPFLHGLRVWRRLLIVFLAIVVLVVAGVMQYSVTRQDTAQAYTEVLATISAKSVQTVAPLPSDPTQAEISAYNRSLRTFDITVREPALREFAASTGPFGWKSWLAVGAAMLDFVFAWALIPFLVLMWILVLHLTRGALLAAALAVGAVDIVVRTTTDAAVSMFNAQPILPVPTTPGPAPATPTALTATSAPVPAAAQPLSTGRSPRPPFRAAQPAPIPGPLMPATAAAAPIAATNGATTLTTRWNPFGPATSNGSKGD